MTDNAGSGGQTGGNNTPRHCLDWGEAPGPKGGLADRKEIVLKEVRNSWAQFLERYDVPVSIAISLIQWVQQRPPAANEPPSNITKAFEDAHHDPGTREGFSLALRFLLVLLSSTLDPDRTEHFVPIPDIIIKGADLPTKRRPGNQPKPHRHQCLGIEVAKATWLTGLTPTRNDTNEPDENTPTNDLPSAADLVARATGLSYRTIVKSWSTPIDGRRPSYLLERWQRASNERG